MALNSDTHFFKGSASRLIINVAIATLCRLVLNTARRFVYPFAPLLSRGLGVPLTAITSLIAINWATTIIAMFFGPITDRIGYRFMMILGVTLLALGMFTAYFLPVYGFLLVGLFLAGLGKSVFDPAVQSYISERVPYRRRGMAIGFLEYSWAGSTLLGIPLIAILIDRFGWRSPFLLMGLMAIIGIAALSFFLSDLNNVKARQSKKIDFKTAWRQIYEKKTARGAIAFIFLLSVANDNLFVVYGAWLENTFGLSIVALGIGTATIGAAELIGESMTASLADRFGLKRSVMTGLSCCIISYIVLPLLGNTIVLALSGLFLIFLTFEFTVVTSVPLVTELLPESRATMMACYMAAAGFGRVVGALIGGPVWLMGGMIATGFVSATISALALLALIWGLHSWIEE
ncbi:MAG: MFS transporter [Desulfobacterales bacterium]|jgi:predicted MFS family arabinose efflux permease